MSYTDRPERDWDAHCDALDAEQAQVDQAIRACIEAASKAIAGPGGLKDAINEAQAGGQIDGDTLAALLLPADGPARWKALRRLALELMTGAVACELYGEPGQLRPSYADADSQAVINEWTDAEQDALAARLAGLFGCCAEVQA